VGDRHPGLTAYWYRTVNPVTGTGKVEEVKSIYEARPLYMEVGVEPKEDVNTAEPARVF
jgi:hypothetical protein